MQFSNQIKQTQQMKNAFFELAQSVHHLDIAAWEEAGWWDNSYIPYTYFENGKAISNASVFDLHFTVDGETKHYIQISTVMTDPAHRRKGLASELLMRIIADYKNRCDGLFLYSSDMALKFYASAGFSPKLESSYFYEAIGTGEALVRIDLTKAQDMETFSRIFAKGNPFARVSIVDDLSLAMFHLGTYLKDCIYYLESEDAILVIDWENGLQEVYGGQNFTKILSALPKGRYELGFTPYEIDGLERKVVNRQLFWLGSDCPQDQMAACMPLLAHA